MEKQKSGIGITRVLIDIAFFVDTIPFKQEIDDVQRTYAVVVCDKHVVECQEILGVIVLDRPEHGR